MAFCIWLMTARFLSSTRSPKGSDSRWMEILQSTLSDP